MESKVSGNRHLNQNCDREEGREVRYETSLKDTLDRICLDEDDQMDFILGGKRNNNLLEG